MVVVVVVVVVFFVLLFVLLAVAVAFVVVNTFLASLVCWESPIISAGQWMHCLGVCSRRARSVHAL